MSSVSTAIRASPTSGLDAVSGAPCRVRMRRRDFSELPIGPSTRRRLERTANAEDRSATTQRTSPKKVHTVVRARPLRSRRVYRGACDGGGRGTFELHGTKAFDDPPAVRVVGRDGRAALDCRGGARPNARAFDTGDGDPETANLVTEAFCVVPSTRAASRLVPACSGRASRTSRVPSRGPSDHRRMVDPPHLARFVPGVDALRRPSAQSRNCVQRPERAAHDAYRARHRRAPAVSGEPTALRVLPDRKGSGVVSRVRAVHELG